MGLTDSDDWTEAAGLAGVASGTADFDELVKRACAFTELREGKVTAVARVIRTVSGMAAIRLAQSLPTLPPSDLPRLISCLSKAAEVLQGGTTQNVFGELKLILPSADDVPAASP